MTYKLSLRDGDEDDGVHYKVRGFPGVRFKDSYGKVCSFQHSSNVRPHVWLGVDHTGLDVKGPSGEINEHLDFGRMHLNVEQARAIIGLLQQFVDEETVAEVHSA